MKNLLSLADKQIRIGTSIALFGGVLLGLFLGVLLVSFENAQLLFENISARIHAVVFLMSVCALISVVLFFPLELGVACGLKIWPPLSKINVKWFYIISFVIGVAFIHAFLSLGFNFVRDITSLKGIALSLGLLLAALVLLLTLVRLRLKSIAHEKADPRAWFLVSLIALLIGLSIISHHSLASSLKRDAGTTNATTSRLVQSLRLNVASSTWNVILISIDTLRYDHLGCYGYTRRTSPHIDRLAEDGIIFRNARSQAPWTLPSHASMMTSLYPLSHGARFWINTRLLNPRRVADILGDWNVTLAEILQAEGFRTAAFTSVPWVSPMFGFDQGFDEFDMDMKTNTATTLIDKGVAWVGNEKRRPFFLFLHFFDVHQYTSPAKYDERYQDADYKGKLKGDPSLLRSLRDLPESLSDADLQYLIAKYDGAISYVDSELGRLFTWLRETDQYDKTLIIVTSDHGEEFREYGWTGHGFTLYEEQLRVPLIIKLPGTKDSQRRREQHGNVGVIDIMPTVLDYLGLPQPPFLEGISLRPLIETDTQLSRTLFAEATLFQNVYVVIQNDFKYIGNRIPPLDLLNFDLLLANIRSFYKFHDDELYRIDRDPDEKLNLLKLEPEVASRMHIDLLEQIQTAKIRQQMVIDKKTVEQLRSLGYIQ